MRCFSLLIAIVFLFILPGIFARADNVFFSDSDIDAIDKINASGTISQFAYTDAFSDPNYYPYGVTLDAAGDVYVALTANFGSSGYGAVKEYSPAGTLLSTRLTSTSVLPISVAVDAQANVYLLGYTVGTNQRELDKIAANGTLTKIYQFPLFHNPNDLALDGAGNIYVVDGAIVKFDASGSMSTFATLPLPTWGIAFDANGNLYATQTDTNGVSSLNTVVKISPGGTVTHYASGFDTPQGLAVDSAGDVYVAENDSSPSLGKIAEVFPNGQQTTIASALYHPSYLAVPVPQVAPPSDTPAMPGWALVVLAILLAVAARRFPART